MNRLGWLGIWTLVVGIAVGLVWFIHYFYENPNFAVRIIEGVSSWLVGVVGFFVLAVIVWFVCVVTGKVKRITRWMSAGKQ